MHITYMRGYIYIHVYLSIKIKHECLSIDFDALRKASQARANLPTAVIHICSASLYLVIGLQLSSQLFVGFTICQN